MNLRPLFLLLVAWCITVHAHSQDNPDVVNKITNFPSAFFDRVNKKTTSLEDRLTRQTTKYLQHLSRQEKKLQKQLSKVDSTAAKQLFANSEQQYAQMINKVSGATSTTIGKSMPGEYLPGMDSLKTSLAFLQQNGQLLDNSQEVQQKIQSSLGNVNALENKLQQTEEVKAFIQQRKQLIQQQLNKYTNLPGSVTSCITGFKEQAYYY